MRATLLLLSVLLTAGCTTITITGEKPKGKLLFSVRETEGAFNGAQKKDTGFFFYLEEREEIQGTVGIVRGIQLERGNWTDYFGGGSDSSDRIVEQLKLIGFEPFDFDVEVKRVKAMRDEEARQKGNQFVVPFALDGAEYEIRFIYGNVDYTLKRWNPMVDIDFYARYSPKIAKLKAIIECFALSYGREKLKL